MGAVEVVEVVEVVEGVEEVVEAVEVADIKRGGVVTVVEPIQSVWHVR